MQKVDSFRVLDKALASASVAPGRILVTLMAVAPAPPAGICSLAGSQ